MRKTIGMLLIAITVTLCSGVVPAHAQEVDEQHDKSANSATQENKPKPERLDKPLHTYRVDFALNELENGKKINTRHYSMNVNVGDRNQVKISTGVRIPRETGVANGAPVSDFVRISTHIYCLVQERGDDLSLDVEGVISNLSTPANLQPENRDIDIKVSTAAIPGKPILVGSVDDPASDREFQLEVTANKVR